MSEKIDKGDENSVFKGEGNDPLGYMIIPIFGVLLVGVVLLWVNQKEKQEDTRFFSVRGKVTVNGKPLNELGKDVMYQIDFYPVIDTNPVASGFIGEGGEFELRSGQTGILGAMAGEYRVVVSMEGTIDNPFRVTQPYSEIKIDPRDGGTMTPEEPDPPFDIDFSDRKTTPQRAIIGESDTVIDFDLTPFKPKPKKKKSDKPQKKSDSESKTKVAEKLVPESNSKTPELKTPESKNKKDAATDAKVRGKEDSPEQSLNTPSAEDKKKPGQ